MRIFYINYADLSVAYGATVCIVELAKSLVKQGHEVTVISSLRSEKITIHTSRITILRSFMFPTGTFGSFAKSGFILLLWFGLQF